MGVSFNAAALLNGNGIDVQSVVSAIINSQSGSLTEWQSEQTTLSSNAGILTGYNNNLTSLATAVAALADPNGALASLTATSSDSTVVTATADSTAAPGTHQVEVDALATTGTIYTEPVSDPTASFLTGGATTGDIQLDVGGTTQDIAITQGTNDTLNTLASYINSQSLGVTANVVTDATGSRLALYSQASGTPGALSIANNTTSLTFDAPIGGTNASLIVDGVPLNTATNVVAGAIPGVTLNLVGTAQGVTEQVDVSPDATAVATAITNFVTAYNTVIGDINTQFTLDPTTNAEGPLGSDVALRSLQSSLLDDVNFSVPGNSGYVNLDTLGVNLNDDGTLTINNSQLQSTFSANPGAFQSFFQNASSTGFANNFNTDLTSLADPNNGVLSLDIANNTATQNDLTDSINNLQDRLSAESAGLTTEFDTVDATLEAFPDLLLEITTEIASLNGTASTTPTTSTTTDSAPAEGYSTVGSATAPA
jgi:flagellar hook-associated protein 2